MSDLYKVAVIGCGRPRGVEGATGFGMGYRHMTGFQQTGKCQLAAVCDLDRGNAEAFVEEFNPDAKIYDDYNAMAEAEELDFVSVCLWPNLHSKVVCDLAPRDIKAIHCEKPMAVHWDAALKMHEACKEHNVQLTFNHQRRFNEPFVRAKELIDEGAIGDLQRMEAAWGNMQDSGTHWFDMMFFFNNDTAVQWVLAQIDGRGARRVFGALQEGQAHVTFRFANGVRANFWGGQDHGDLGCMIRVYGSEGIIEIHRELPWLQVLRFGEAAWKPIDTKLGIHGDEGIYKCIADLVDCVETGRYPMLGSANALRTAEVIFAAFESSRRRARVDLPLPAGKSALVEMIESGELETDLE